MLVYVESHDTNIEDIIKDMSSTVGYYNAKSIVDNWIKEYSSFCYESTTGELLFTQMRSQGYWMAHNSIEKYKK